MPAVRTASLSGTLARYRCVDRCSPSRRHARRSATATTRCAGVTAIRAARRGLEVSLGTSLQDLVGDCQVDHRPPQPRVFTLHLLEPLGLPDLNAPVLLPPALIGLFGDLQRFAHLRHRSALRQATPASGNFVMICSAPSRRRAISPPFSQTYTSDCGWTSSLGAGQALGRGSWRSPCRGARRSRRRWRARAARNTAPPRWAPACAWTRRR